MKRTIAWIGSTNRKEDILEKLAEHYHVLWVRKEDSLIPVLNQRPGSKVEIIDCVKDGCWEADIIVFTEEEVQEDLLVKIREVATQKTVLVMSSSGSIERREGERLSRIKAALPYSKIVKVALHPDEPVLSGENPQAVATAKEIVRLLE